MIRAVRSIPDMAATSMRQEDRVLLAHGGGGQLTDELLGRVVMPRLGNAALSELLDSGLTERIDSRIAMTIDGYVVQPLFFPGGDIGRLAVSGTVNDLSVCGAEPVGLALSLILEEGLEQRVLERVMESIRTTADEAGVRVITGDTKVVSRGQADGIYITTSGIGKVVASQRLHPDQVRPGDVILLSGPIADHGLSVMLAREMPDVKSVLRSDVAPLNRMVLKLAREIPQVVFMRDPTRGGLAGVAADLAVRCGFNITLDESAIQVRPETLHAAEMLGLDPLEVANEGKVVVVVRPEAVDAALNVLHADEHGRHARVIGRVEPERDGLCELITGLGGRRILQKPYGEQLPRIC